MRSQRQILRERVRVAGAGRGEDPGAIAVLDREERANQGSEDLTIWCPCCLERTIPSRSGICLFCDTPLTEKAIEREASSKLTSKFGNSGTADRADKVDRARASRAEGARVKFDSEDARKLITASNYGKPKPEPTPRIPRRRDRRHKHGKPYSDEQILARIKLWTQVVGSPPSKADWTPSKLKRAAATARGVVERHLTRVALYELGDFPSETTVRERFGSMNSALVQAGFELRPTGRQPTTGTNIGTRPKVGRKAIAAYMEAVTDLLDGDEAQFKRALYDLSLSALYLADRLSVPEP